MEEARLKWADLAKECASLAAKVNMVPNLEADVVELRKIISKLCTAHQDEIKGLRKTHQAEVERLCDLHLVEI